MAVAYAKADCGYGAAIACVGPVLEVYADKDCEVPVTYHQLYPSATAQSKTCYESSNSTSWKFGCGRHITREDYTQSGCKGEKTIWRSVNTGKCFKASETQWHMYVCASASTFSYSIFLLASLALFALFI